MTEIDAFGVPQGIDPAAAFNLGGAPNYRAILDSLPAAIYTTDAEGTLTYFNRAAVDIAGREPRLGIDRWCVSWKLFRPDGTSLPHDQCPMALAIREQRAVRGMDIIIERPDGQRVPALPFPTPIHDAAGRFAGAINLLVDISRLKSTEHQVERHATEQAALYRFTDRLYRAETDQDIYEAALDAIIGALGCDRASVLLFDDGGIMRFVASRGLSPAYRAAVDGHSPWRPGDRDPSPIFVPDIMASQETKALKRIVRNEGLTALAFIPLTADGVVVGKFMTYYEGAHQFSDAERDLAVTIARQLGFAIEQRRAERTRKAMEDQRDLLLAELSHRVKNTLATVVSIARQSFGKGATLEGARRSFEGRLRALAQTHTRLAEANWESVPLAALIEDEIAPYRDEGGNRLVIDGPPVNFTPKQAVVLGMALHELATNAAKYGALSSKAGTVSVVWRYDGDGRLSLDWQESGGPAVVSPKRSGFGRLLLERALAADLKGDVHLDFRPTGLACRITLPPGSTGVPRPVH